MKSAGDRNSGCGGVNLGDILGVIKMTGFWDERRVDVTILDLDVELIPQGCFELVAVGLTVKVDVSAAKGLNFLADFLGENLLHKRWDDWWALEVVGETPAEELSHRKFAEGKREDPLDDPDVIVRDGRHLLESVAESSIARMRILAFQDVNHWSEEDVDVIVMLLRDVFTVR